MSYSQDEIEQLVYLHDTPDTAGGIKYDGDKPRYELIPPHALEEMVKVLTVGAKKYDDENWRKLDNLANRYRGALLRHTMAIAKGELYDDETGLLHSAHAMCCTAFLTEYYKLKELGQWKGDN